MEDRSSSGHWAYKRYLRPNKKPNNENENPFIEAIQAQGTTSTSTKRKRSKRQKKLHQTIKNTSQAEDTCNVLQNKRNVRIDKLKQIEIKSTKVFNNSALDLPSTNQIKHRKSTIIHNQNAKPSKYVALDCEMVRGLGKPPEYGQVRLAASVSIVNEHLECIYNKYVKPKIKVVDYRTKVSGITKQDLNNYGIDFHIVQGEVASILKGKVLVGHAIQHDMNVLYLNHPAQMIRDTADYAPLKRYNRGKTPSLKVLAKKILGLDIQEGAHDSISDALASMQLYLALADEWEAYIVNEKAFLQMKRLENDVWCDKRKYSNAECRYYEILAKKAKASKFEESEIGEATQPTSVSNETISPKKLDTVNSTELNKEKETADGGSKADLNESNRQNSQSEKFSGGPARIPNTPVQQAVCKNGDTNHGILKSAVLNELSSLEMGATCYLKMAIELATNSFDFVTEMAAIQTKEKIGQQERYVERTELDHRIDEISKLVDAIKLIRNT